MLAINHVTLATAGALAVSLYVWQQPFFLPFIAFVVFASLLPDIDHPGSEISNYFPLIHKALPHRGITHSIVGVGIFAGALYFLLGYNTILSVALIIAGFIGIQFLGELLKHRINQIQNLTGDFLSNKQIRLMIRIVTGVLSIFLIILAFVIWKERFREEILMLLVVGYIAHIVGDIVTKEGVPILWPIKDKLGFKLFRTGSFLEVVIGFGLFLANIFLLSQFWNTYNLSGTEYWRFYLGI